MRAMGYIIEGYLVGHPKECHKLETKAMPTTLTIINLKTGANT